MEKQKSRVKELARQENSIIKHQIPISFRQPPCVSFVSCSRLFAPLSVSFSSLSLSPDGVGQRHELASYDDEQILNKRLMFVYEYIQEDIVVERVVICWTCSRQRIVLCSKNACISLQMTGDWLCDN
jgi:hypothetical protein